MHARKLLALAGFLFCASRAEAALVFGSHSYQLTSSASDWVTAQAEAVALGGSLVSVNSAAEQLFLEQNLLAGGVENRPVWIGLNDASTEGTFLWADGTAPSYLNWKNGEPNNYGGTEDFVAMNWEYARQTGPKGTWNDAPLGGSVGFGGNTDGPYYGIVEFAFNVNPLSSSDYITYNGLDWAWASPVAAQVWGSNQLLAPGTHSGWRYATAEEMAYRPSASAFLTNPNDTNSARNAAAYWNTEFTHIDYGDGVSGQVRSQPDGSSSETWYVRGTLAVVPEPALRQLLSDL